MPLVHYRLVDGIAELLLDRPPVNAVDGALIDELLAGLERARLDTDARAVIIASAQPRRFCAGLDIRAVDGQPSEVMHRLLERLYVQMTDAQFRLGKPSIAAVAGAARGAGMTIAIGCDLIVAERTATFGYPEIDVGLIPAIHFAHLPRIVGRHRAFDLLFTGRSFGADEAAALGLVSRVVQEGEALAQARALGAVLAAKAPGVMRRGRADFLRECDSDYRRGVAAAVENFTSLATSAESREGIRAFVEKRPAAWSRPQADPQA
jgi:enoyl-CoA hydratase/carnithine racemase